MGLFLDAKKQHGFLDGKEIHQLPGATRKVYDCVTSLLCWKMPIIPHQVVPWFLCHDNCISLHNLRLNKTNHWLVGQLLLQLGLAVLVSETNKFNGVKPHHPHLNRHMQWVSFPISPYKSLIFSNHPLLATAGCLSFMVYNDLTVQ